MSLDTLNIINDQLDNDIVIVLSGRGEPTMHPDFDKIVNILISKRNVVVFTNGYNFEKYKDSLKKVYTIIYDIYSENEDDFNEAIENVKSFNNNVSIQWKKENGIFVKEYRNWENKTISKNKDFVTNRAGQIESNFSCSNSCDLLIKSIFIDWNGDYNLCCFDWLPTVMGNVHDEDIMDYYLYNKKLNEYREGLKSGNRLSPCDVCDR